MTLNYLDFAVLSLRRSFGAIALAVGFLSVASTHAGIIDWVTVGDPGNAADTTGYGAVADSFRIMKYEFTNQQYTDFLNSVASTDPYSLYDPGMQLYAPGGIVQSGQSGSYTYSVRPNMGDKPVNYVSWFTAARVANWLHNGATSSSSTETGAYTLNGATSGNAPGVNPGAMFYIPPETQWYKAAYYKGGSTNAGYWTFATQSNSTPTAVSADSSGNGSAGSTGNFANVARGATWNGKTGIQTTVGTNGGASAYGAFDMTGNLFEFNSLTGTGGSHVGARGGDWFYSDVNRFASKNYRETSTAVNGTNDSYGFRLASPVIAPVPEIDPAGMGSVLALVTSTLALIERRRLKVA